MKNKIDTRKLAVLAMLSALAYLAMVVFRIPVISIPGLTLKYEPKDVIMATGGFIFGPLSAFAMSVIVSFVEMVTVSETAWIGFAMNIVSSCAFICSAALIYKKWRSMAGAVAGLAAGALLTTIVMLLWNYFLVPIYTGAPREMVAGLLVPVFLPFNLLKGGLNSAITVLIYKPVTTALRKSGLLPKPENAGQGKGKINAGLMLLAGFVLITCVLFALVLRGDI